MSPARTKAVLRPGADALLLVDVLNDLEFAGGARVLPWAERLVRPLRALCARARRAGIPVIYANDHGGLWRASAQDVYARCTRKGARGRDVSRRLKPARTDYVVLKPRHSAFFGTPMRPLLEELGVRRLVLSGIATNLCVLATAHDASMHGYPLVVLSDCCAAESDFDHNVVLSQLERYFGAKICRSDELRIGGRPKKTRRARLSGARSRRRPTR
jgi:nicotinamidase-related amidase